MDNTLQSDSVRIQVLQAGDTYYLIFEAREDASRWETIMGSGLIAPLTIWSTDTAFLCEDPFVEWYEGTDLHQTAAFYHEQAVENQQRMELRGLAGRHLVTETIEIAGPEQVHITVVDDMETPGTLLGQLMTHLYFIPDKCANRSFEPLDFAWLPALHKQKEHVCADHFFRSPAVIVKAGRYYAALVPDLDLFAQYRSIPHALDLRTTETILEAPRLSYGVCVSTRNGHVYFKHEKSDFAVVESSRLCYGFDLFFGYAATTAQVTEKITQYLWEKYGHRFFRDIRPQVLPFAEYGRRYTYIHELPRSVKSTDISGAACCGINNVGRRGANFHAWENDLHTGYGIKYYADQWDNAELHGIADGILQLSLSAPLKQGAFPCIYNFEQQRFEGTLYWTARSADPIHGYDSAAMSVSAWWLLYWYQDFGMAPQILERVLAYSEFLKKTQLQSGTIPTYFFSDLRPAKQLLESATTAISGAVLAKIATITSSQPLKESAILAGRFVEGNIIPGLNFNDFEAYYSCSPKPLHALDYWSGIRPHCNLSLQWACDQFLALYRLTGESSWLRTGEYLLSILSLYQQVWKPSHFREYLFGGFGVMNTDAEWNDGRQARFVSTYADYYLETGKTEYLERAVAACRSAFALMDIPENHANQINNITMRRVRAWVHEPDHMQPGVGYAPENSQHSGGERETWTGLNWSSGGALAASAYLAHRFGAVWVDGTARIAVPIDGLSARVDSWQDDVIGLTINSALSSLACSYTVPRKVLVRFGRLPDRERSYTVVINGESHTQLGIHDLAQGLLIALPDGE